MPKIKMHLISNMYPSESNIRYGIFVKRFEELLNNDFDINKIVITKKYSTLSKLIAYMRAYFSIVKLYFTSSKKDIIYIHFPLHFAPILFPFILLNRKLVINFHGSDAIFDSTIKKILSIFLKPLVKRSTTVVPSEYFKNVVIEIFNIKVSSVYVFPSGGVDKSIFYPISKNNEHFTLGFISNFIESKGWRILLESLKTIKDSNTIESIKLIMVGDGPDKDKIQAYIDKYNLDVKLIDSVNQKELVYLYSKFDVFIFPTYRKEESLGLVGLESMMSGVPIIASNIAGPSGYVVNGVNGYLFEPKNSSMLAEKIIEYYNLSIYSKKTMKLEAIETAKEYESNKVVKTLIEFLNDL